MAIMDISELSEGKEWVQHEDSEDVDNKANNGGPNSTIHMHICILSSPRVVTVVVRVAPSRVSSPPRFALGK